MSLKTAKLLGGKSGKYLNAVILSGTKQSTQYHIWNIFDEKKKNQKSNQSSSSTGLQEIQGT